MSLYLNIFELVFIPVVIDELCRFVVVSIVDVMIFELVFIPVVDEITDVPLIIDVVVLGIVVVDV